MTLRSLFRTLIVISLVISLTACAGTLDQIGAQTFNSLRWASEPVEPAAPAVVESLETARPLKKKESGQRLFSASAALDDEERFVRLYKSANPAVVNIQVTTSPVTSDTQGWVTPPGDEGQNMPPLPFQFSWPGTPHFQPFPLSGQGSGFVFDRDGHIVTNHHVIAQADAITVIFSDGTEVDAELVGADPNTDLAVIRVDPAEAPPLEPLPLGSSADLAVGQIVISIGNPFGLSGSMSTGIISGLGRVLPAAATSFTIPDIIQTDAAINPGNSGGPLLNLDGEVIGVNTAIESRSGGFAGIGYAVPVDTVRGVVPDLIENGEVAHPWLGISGRTLDRETAESMNLDPSQRGVLVVEVVADGPAFKSGLQGSATQTSINGRPSLIGGDVIVGIDGQVVTDFDDLLTTIVHQTEVGQTVTLELFRDGQRQEIDVTLEARPELDTP